MQVALTRDVRQLTFRLGFVLWSETVPKYADYMQRLLNGEIYVAEPIFFGVNEYAALCPAGYDDGDWCDAVINAGDVLNFELSPDLKLTIWHNGEVLAAPSDPIVVPPGYELYFGGSLSGRDAHCTLQPVDRARVKR